jgi:RNA polymerase sigma-70 factor (ECF subfamily)
MGKDDFFERLYEDHAAALLSYLVYRTGNITLAEDILADTFERVLTARRPFVRREATERTWLYTIAMNRLRDVTRRQGAEERALERVDALGRAGSAQGANVDTVERRDLIQRALKVLPDDEQEALALRYGADLSLREIAQLTGERQTTVEGRVYRGLRHLREELGH